MKIYQRAIIILVLISIFGCVDQDKRTKESHTPDQITLIFIDRPDNGTYHHPEGGTGSSSHFQQLSYFDENLIMKWVSPDSTALGDTLIIPTKTAFREIFHAYRGIEKLSFLVEKGDTIVFTYDGLQPKAFSKKYQTTTNDINLSVSIKNEVFNNEFEAYTKHWTLPIEEQIKLGRFDKTEEYNGELYKENDEKRRWLDENYENKKISKDYYDYYVQDLEYGRLFIENQLNPISKERFHKTINEIGDSLLNRPYYFGFISMYIEKLKDGAQTYSYQTSDGGSMFIDHEFHFDRILEDTVLTQKMKDIFLYNTLIRMIEDKKKPAVSTKYYQKFKAQAENSSLVQILGMKYRLENEVSSDLNLISLDSSRIDFSKLIKQYKGKVIYIDIWAGWCQPCIKEIPFSKQLAEKYKGEDFVVLYLSKDTKKGFWKENCVELDLNPKHSFFVENLYTTSFFDEINARFIPYYLIYDKNGKLDYMDAPRPSDNKIYTEIERRLK